MLSFLGPFLKFLFGRVVLPRLPVIGFLGRPPFRQPTRADWVAERVSVRGKELRRTAGDRLRSAWMDAAHATVRGANATDKAGGDFKRAALATVTAGLLGAPKPKEPPPRKSGLFGGRPPPEKTKVRGRGRRRGKAAAPAQTFGVVEAAGLFVLAGVIIAWPRPGRPPLLQPVRDALEKAVGHPLGDTPLAASGAEALEPGRGREATSPLAIPPRGWKDVLVRTWSEFNADQIPAVAGGVTFFGLLAMFPALAAFVSLYGLFADVTKAREQLRLLAGFLPHDALVFVGDEMVRIAGGYQGSLGLAFVISFLASLWSANGAVKALIYGLNVAYEEKERRNFVVLNLTSLTFTLGAIVFTLVAVGAVVALPVALSSFGLNEHMTVGGAWIAELRWPALLIVLILGLSTLYRYGPSRQHSRWRWITVGGVAAGVLWVGASLLFSWYVANFAHYDRTYGSLGAVIGFMFWLWYSMTIVLFGAELNAELEHQTAVDTTTGDPKPPGARGAKMADTLGRARGA